VTGPAATGVPGRPGASRRPAGRRDRDGPSDIRRSGRN